MGLDRFKQRIPAASANQTRLDEFGEPKELQHCYPKAYVKILITGPYQSGKTSFIHGLDTNAIRMEREGKAKGQTTTGFDFASFYWLKSEKGGEVIPKQQARIFEDKERYIPVRVYGMPGLRHFSTVREVLSQRSDGAVLILDSTNPRHIEEFDIYYQEIRRSLKPDTPVLIIANKQDLPNAISSLNIQEKIAADLPVLPASSRTGEGVLEAFNQLMDLVYTGNGGEHAD
ncbi:MAG: ADP-ribosylation factor-like protein [Candidatus Ranarchaeia archaeon]